MVVAQVGQGVVSAFESGGEGLGRGNCRLAKGQLGERTASAELTEAAAGRCMNSLGVYPFFLWRNFLFWGCAWSRLVVVCRIFFRS